MAQRRQVGSFGIPEGAAKNLVVWFLVLTGLVFGLVLLAAVEVFSLLTGS
jgi:hypothetical protein